MEQLLTALSESRASESKILLTAISKETVIDIYRSESVSFKQSIIEACLIASVQELRVLFEDLGPIGWKLGNFLCSEKAFVANLRTSQNFVLFRNGIRITKLAVNMSFEKKDHTKSFSGKVVKLKKQNKPPKIIYKKGKPFITNLVFYECLVKKII